MKPPMRRKVRVSSFDCVSVCILNRTTDKKAQSKYLSEVKLKRNQKPLGFRQVYIPLCAALYRMRQGLLLGMQQITPLSSRFETMSHEILVKRRLIGAAFRGHPCVDVEFGM